MTAGPPHESTTHATAAAHPHRPGPARPGPARPLPCPAVPAPPRTPYAAHPIRRAPRRQRPLRARPHTPCTPGRSPTPGRPARQGAPRRPRTLAAVHPGTGRLGRACRTPGAAPGRAAPPRSGDKGSRASSEPAEQPCGAGVTRRPPRRRPAPPVRPLPRAVPSVVVPRRLWAVARCPLPRAACPPGPAVAACRWAVVVPGARGAPASSGRGGGALAGVAASRCRVRGVVGAAVTPL